jgi:predicted metal-dependent RNase
MHEGTLSEYRTQIRDELPADADIDDIRFEGPELVIYTSTPEAFAEDNRLVGRLASTLQKRLTVRPTADARSTRSESETAIRDLLPEDAGLRDIEFQHVDGGSDQRQEIADGEPAIVLSTSGMVTGGPIFSWLDLLGTDPANTLVFVGYQAAGTMGRRIQQGRREVTLPRWDGGESRVTLQLRVEDVSGFSGHADRQGLENYVRTMSDRPERILCVHGDETATNQFSSALYEEFGMATYQPRNLETFRCD